MKLSPLVALLAAAAVSNASATPPRTGNPTAVSATEVAEIARHLRSSRAPSGINVVDKLLHETINLVAELEFAKASDKVNEALRLDAGNANIHFLNGLIYHLQARTGDARKAELAMEGYKQVINFDASHADAYYFLGLAQFDLRQFVEAQASFAHALILKPRDSEAALRLVAASYMAGDPTTSCSVAHRLLSSGELSEAQRARALRISVPVFSACKDFDRANLTLDSLARLSPRGYDPDALKSRIEDWKLFYATLPPGAQGSSRTGAAQMIRTQAGVTPAARPAAAPPAGPVAGGAPATDGAAPAEGAPAPADAPGTSLPGAAPAAAAAQPGVQMAAQVDDDVDPPLAPVSPGGAGAGGAGTAGSQDAMASIPDIPNCGRQSGLPPSKRNRMVLIDVVLLRTEDNLITQSGVNLLSGLTLMFGGQNSPAYSRFSTSATGQTTVTRGITVPALTYAMNIANANSSLTEVLAKPSLTAMECKKSEFFSGTSLTAAVVSTAGTGGGAVQIERKYGVRLGIVTEILKDNQIRMYVDAARTFLQPPSNNIAFTYKVEISEIQAKANVVLRLGDTLVLGGLSETQNDVTRDGVPGLQDTPVVQYLFSQKTTTKFNRSVLMLITPRQANYTWMSDETRASLDPKNPFLPPLDILRARYGDWFKPFPNLASVFHHMNLTSLYREFRTADVMLEKWDRMETTRSRLRQALDFLYY